MRCIATILFVVLAAGPGVVKAQEILSFTAEPLEPVYRLKFADSTNDAYLRGLRKNYRLDSITRNDTGTLMKVLSICNWVRQQWEHNGSNVPQKHDPVSILEEAATGKNFRCVEYGTVVAGCLNALGITARVVGLKTKDVETAKTGAGHVVTEAYIPELHKWVMVDGQWNVMPFLDKIPLNAVELQKAIVKNEKGLHLYSIGKKKADKKYKKWILPYLYYFDTATDLRYFPEKYAYIQRMPNLMLAPVNTPCPTVFQRKWGINAVCTHSLEVFYQAPAAL